MNNDSPTSTRVIITDVQISLDRLTILALKVSFAVALGATVLGIAGFIVMAALGISLPR